ncbi:MAG: hypothetical protein EBS56_09355 [Planctomycetia bacterium]|nr:hypothetical protein [Planctomycetia bacterium]
MGRMARWAATWADHTFALDLRSLACLRVALGLIVCADAVLRTRDATLMLAPDGMFPPPLVRSFFGDRWAWSLGFFVDATWWGMLLLALEGLAGIALAAGLGTRPASCLAWVAVVSVLRRTAPATNAGDEWLACLLFWGMFLPWGEVWSIDDRRRRRHGASLRVDAAPATWSLAGVALVLQIAAVYLGAAISKWNPTWLSGDAVASALSIHDHGTVWGDALTRQTAACRVLTWAVLGLESAAPFALVATGRPTVRIALLAMFLVFHAATAVLMSLGLFAAVGAAAWLALIPTACWDRWLHGPVTPILRARAERTPRGGWLETWLVAAALAVAVAAFLHAATPWRASPMPSPLAAAVRATCLVQDWDMFGEVRRQRQWVYGRGTLADGRTVDVLRDGRPLEDTLPRGGFTTLPHHRWHKLFWELPEPDRRRFAPSVAAALAHDWNRRHTPADRLVALDIVAVRLFDEAGDGAGQETRQELFLATWPPRDATGRGNLDRWLRDQVGE